MGGCFCLDEVLKERGREAADTAGRGLSLGFCQREGLRPTLEKGRPAKEGGGRQGAEEEGGREVENPRAQCS